MARRRKEDGAPVRWFLCCGFGPSAPSIFEGASADAAVKELRRRVDYGHHTGVPRTRYAIVRDNGVHRWTADEVVLRGDASVEETTGAVDALARRLFGEP